MMQQFTVLLISHNNSVFSDTFNFIRENYYSSQVMLKEM